MALSSELVSQFAKLTKTDKNAKTESTHYGTAVEYNGSIYVQLDGSDVYTPVDSTTNVKVGDRVMVLIKNHSATVTGNVTNPSVGKEEYIEVKTEMKDVIDEVTEVEILIAHKVSATELEAINATIENLRVKTASFVNIEALNAEIDNLEAKFANVDHLSAKDIEAINANIESIQVKFADIMDISAEQLEALNAEITNLKGYTADFTYLSTDVLEAIRADIKELDVKKLNVESADLKYANIDFSNIGEAAIEKIFADSGIIRDLIVSEGKITGELVGVTIKGDLIEAGTLKADRLVVKGSDGNYYKLSTDFTAMPEVEPVEEDSIHGSTIIAESITAEKIAVDDLVAFDATIGGFNITENSLYSGVKESVDNATRGVYLDNTGQVAFGDGSNYLRYFKDQNGNYKLEISANSILLGSSNKTIETVVKDTVDDITIGAKNLIRNSENLIFADYYFDETMEPEGASITISHDGLGNVELHGTTLNATHDGNGNVYVTY